MATKTYVYNPPPDTKGVATGWSNHGGYGALVARITQRFDTSRAANGKNKISEIKIEMELRNRSNEAGVNSNLTVFNASSLQTGTLKVIDNLSGGVVYSTTFNYTFPIGTAIGPGQTWGGALHTMDWRAINHNDNGEANITVQITATWNNWASGSGTESVSKNITDLKKTKMNINFNANGGSGGPTTALSHFYGAPTTLPTTIPTRPGYKFLGWTTRNNSPAATFTQNNKNINLNGTYIKKAKRTINNTGYFELLVNSTSPSMRAPHWNDYNEQDDLKTPWQDLWSGSWGDSSGGNNTYNFGYARTNENFDVDHIKIDNYGNQHFQNYNIHLYAYNSSGSQIDFNGSIPKFDIPFFSGGVFNYFTGNNITLYANWEKIPGTIYIRVNGVWKPGVAYIKVNDVWKEGSAYIMNSNTWKTGST